MSEARKLRLHVAGAVKIGRSKDPPIYEVFLSENHWEEASQAEYVLTCERPWKLEVDTYVTLVIDVEGNMFSLFEEGTGRVIASSHDLWSGGSSLVYRTYTHIRPEP